MSLFSFVPNLYAGYFVFCISTAIIFLAEHRDLPLLLTELSHCIRTIKHILFTFRTYNNYKNIHVFIRANITLRFF